MFEKFEDIASTELAEDEGENRVLELSEAIRRYLNPGMTLYIREGSYAAIREIIRQFWGTGPEFSLVMVGCRDYALDLIHCGLVTRLITSRCSESPTQGRSLTIQRAYEQKSLEIENWTLYSLPLRLMAGALGLEFLPTKSILHSSMAQENKDSFTEVDDPFGSGQKLGLVKALNPDIAIVHGWAADRSGNIITAPPILSGEGEWGAFASKNGVVATVEKLVSTEFIREHASLVTIPSYFVKSVSVVPFGAHPQVLAAVTKEFAEYEADYEFMEEHRQATKDTKTLDAWLKGWVLDCPSNEDYLKKLGSQRLASLKGQEQVSQKHKLLPLSEEAITATKYSATEMMIVAASRVIKEKVMKNGYKVILSGVGTAGLAAWLAYYELRKAGVEVELMIGSGLYGWAPRPTDPQLTSLANLRTCKMITDVVHAYGIFARNQCLPVIGAGELDKYGNLNSTKRADTFYLAGSGGANDAATAREIVVVAAQSKRRFVSKVPYITCSGRNVGTVVSDKGVFEKVNNGDELTLVGYFGDLNAPEQDRIVRKIQDDCGWELKVHHSLKKIDPPNPSELALMRILNPSIVES